MSLAGAAIVGAESILALTPVAIKQTALDPISAILSRLLSSAAIGYALTSDHTLPRSEWLRAAALGYTNLLHVATSYEAFRHLPAGQAMGLLYTYPMWNLVMNAYFNNETIAMRDYGIMGLASIGSVLLNLNPGVAAPTTIGREAKPLWGVFMGIVMALTESGMHTLLKGLNWLDPSKSVFVISTSASILLCIFLFVQELLLDGHSGPDIHYGSWWDAVTLTAFHAVTLFSGYWLRFYAVPRLSTVTYSILSYAGLFASYIYGIVFLHEQPGWLSVFGAILIVVSGLMIKN